jgi:protease I
VHSLERGEIQLVDGDLTPAGAVVVDEVVTDVSADDYHGPILPGGTVNADRLRTSTEVRAFVAAMLFAGRPVDAIWVLIDTEIVAGHNRDVLPEYADRSAATRGCQPRGPTGRPGREPAHQPRS